jgi:hypothetical protein
MARAHTAGKEKHGNMATGLASVQEFLRRKKKEFLYAKFSSHPPSAIAIRITVTVTAAARLYPLLSTPYSLLMLMAHSLLFLLR